MKLFGLGILGFDHLDIVYVPKQSAAFDQERWFVLEGVRDVDPASGRAVLGVVGWDGATTLAEANGGRRGRELAQHLGSPEDRGGHTLAVDGEALRTWSLMASAAGDIARAHYPYIPYAPEASALPTLNSSSLVSSLMFHAGLDYATNLPSGLRFSPGLSTLIASSGDDVMKQPEAYDAVLGGAGDDRLGGRASPALLDKLYGGRGADTLIWSPGQSVMHGGEPGLAYADDGTDRVSYAGAGPVEITGRTNAEAHVSPDFTATHPSGRDDLYSIEELVWDDRSDHITVGPGAGLLRSSLSLSTSGGDDWIDASQSDVSLSIESGSGDDVVIAGARPLLVKAGEGRDTIVLDRGGARVDLLDADRDDRIEVLWNARSVELSRDPDAPADAVIAIFGEAAEPALVRVTGYRAGMLGLCIEPPAQIPPEALQVRGASPPCGRADALAVSTGRDAAKLWVSPDDDTSSHLLPAGDEPGHF